MDRITSKLSFKTYALRRVRRKAAFGNASSRLALAGFLQEIKIVSTISNKHAVQYVGSYTDKKQLVLIMPPVADSDLAFYSERLSEHIQASHLEPSRASEPLYRRPIVAEIVPNIKSLFGCLASALAYLHSQDLRHKDMKLGMSQRNRACSNLVASIIS